MSRHVRRIVLVSVAAALVVFLVVQDRVTAAGARRYVALQRSAINGRTVPVTIDEIMRPAVERSVRLGLLWGALVLAAGLGTAVIASRRDGDRPGRRGGPLLRTAEPGLASRVAQRPDLGGGDA